MNPEQKIEWEDIFNKNNYQVQFATARARVEGGWLISHSLSVRDQVATSICFMADPDHKWNLNNE